MVGFVTKITPKKPIPCGVPCEVQCEGHGQPPNGRNLRVAGDEHGRPNGERYYVKKVDDRDRFERPTDLMSADGSNENLSTTSDRLGLSAQVNNTGFPSNPGPIGSFMAVKENLPRLGGILLGLIR